MTRAKAVLLWCLAGSVFLLPALVLAQEVIGAQPVAPAPTALSQLSDGLLDIIIPLVVALVGGAAAWLLAVIKKKTGIDIEAKTAAAWSDLARKGAMRAAEYARQKVKHLADGEKIPGPELLEVAATFAIKMAKEQKLPELATEKLKGLIEANLFELRIETAALENAAAATTDVPKV